MAPRRKKAELEQEIRRLEQELKYATQRVHDARESQEQSSRDDVHADLEREESAAPTKPSVTVNLPLQENFNGQGRPWESFISSFRSLAEACNWSEQEQRFRLLACLRGDAADFVFQQLGDDVVNDFDNLVDALENRFGERNRRLLSCRSWNRVALEQGSLLRNMQLTFVASPHLVILQRTPRRLIR